MTDQDLFRAIGTALFGSQWQGELARQLDVNPTTLQRWANGKFAIPPGIWTDLAKLSAARQAEIARLQPLLERQAASTSTSTSE